MKITKFKTFVKANCATLHLHFILICVYTLSLSMFTIYPYLCSQFILICVYTLSLSVFTLYPYLCLCFILIYVYTLSLSVFTLDPHLCLHFILIYVYALSLSMSTLDPYLCLHFTLIYVYTYKCYLFQGLYAMSMNCMEAAEAQFQTALKVQTVVTLYNVCSNVIQH